MRMQRKPRQLMAIAGLSLTLVPAPAGADATASAGETRAAVDLRQWQTPADFRAGRAEGTGLASRTLVITDPIGTVERTEAALGTTKTYEYARWTAPLHRPGFGATQLVSSWNAGTPDGTWIEIELRGRMSTGATTGWYVMGAWASGDGSIHRTSVPGQRDATGSVSVDTFSAADGTTLDAYELRVTLYRLKGSERTPRLRMVGAMTSRVPARFTVPTSRGGGAWGKELRVPRYSQEIHRGQYPQYDGGGEAWCSPTSTEMVVEYWGRGPTPQQLAWVDPSYADPSVDVAARDTYDYAYRGAGNWPFNTAYAASYGLHAYVTRLRSLTELEQYVKRGVPVITSVSFRADELSGSGYSTNGHLLVVVGFTPRGDVIVNDPAAPDDAAVRRVYRRDQFENVWQRTKRTLPDGTVGSGPGGVAYVITPQRRRGD